MKTSYICPTVQQQVQHLVLLLTLQRIVFGVISPFSEFICSPRVIKPFLIFDAQILSRDIKLTNKLTHFFTNASSLKHQTVPCSLLYTFMFPRTPSVHENFLKVAPDQRPCCQNMFLSFTHQYSTLTTA